MRSDRACARRSRLVTVRSWASVIAFAAGRRDRVTGGDYRILTRTALCSGHARCHAVAPDIFNLNADGYNDTAERTIDASALEAAQRGMRACPERAISIVQGSENGGQP